MSLKMLWSLPVITVYLYVATILTTVGYFDYFGVPSYFVEASIQSNTIYLFSLFGLAMAVFASMRWWTLAIVILIAGFIFYFYHSAKWRRWVVSAVVFFALGWMLVHSFNFGGTLAKYNVTYLVPAADCSGFGTSTQLMGIGTYDGREIFVTVDPASHKQLGGFTLKDLSATSCVFEQKLLWQIEK